jgi:hypothetical protein
VVGDHLDDRAIQFSNAGSVMKVRNTPGRPAGVGIDGNGNLFISTENNVMAKYTPASETTGGVSGSVPPGLPVRHRWATLGA